MTSLLFAVALAVSWLSSPNDALQAARNEKKIVMVHYRPSCDRCNDDADRTLEAAANDPVFRQALDAFVPLRMDAGPAVVEHFGALGRERRPLLAFYTPDGVFLGWLDDFGRGWPGIAEQVLAMRGARNAAVASAELRAKGNLADADFSLGMALTSAKRFESAARKFDEAAAAYQKAGDRESEQLARVYSGYAWAISGQRERGRSQIIAVRRNPVSNRIAAEAHLAIGELSEVEARTMAMMAPATSQLFRTALESYRKAYALAPAGTPLLEKIRSAIARLDSSPLPPKDAQQPTIAITPPVRRTVTGPAEFLATADEQVVRVDFLLDEKKVASATETPFRATIDVGATPRVRAVKAIAYDKRGRAIGEATTTINDRFDAFLLNIVAPVGPALAGKAEAEVDAKFAADRKLAKLEVSWNEKPLAVTSAPPYRAAFDVAAGEFGYLRAVGVLDDGTTAETVRVFNAAGVSESVEVANVVVIASVTGEDGERIPNLTASDFALFDEDQRVEPQLRSADDDPVTIGIAVDSSSSMRGKQIHMMRAAAELLTQAMRPQDHAFVVSFDSAPRLIHPRSTNVDSLRNSLLRALPAGGTSIFDGVTLALQQFQGLPGKKALIVFSDGEEGRSGASAAECERLARSVGVPVYAVLPPNGVRFRNALGDIVGATGGLMLDASPDPAELDATVRRLAREVRGQYVLSYIRPAGIEAGSWRRIRLAVDRPGAKVRTIEGYRAW